MSVGQNLRRARRHLRLSQTAVADELGVTRQTIAGFEKGTAQPQLHQLAVLANLYRLTLDELVRAQSAVSPVSAPPAHLTRSNKAGVGGGASALDEQDQRELLEFEKYLRERPPTRGEAFKPTPLSTVSQCVEQLRDEYGLRTEFPVPVLALIGRMGIEVRFTALGNLAGALILATERSPAGILVNSDQPQERQRFSAAHELGHLVLDHEPKNGGFVSFLGRRFDPVEVDADNFAAELLTPTDLLAQRVRELARPDVKLEEAVYKLARSFAVSYQAMTTRLAKLGVLRPSQVEQLQKMKPATIAKRIGGEPCKEVPFDQAWIPHVARASMAKGWERKAGPDTVRTLQECVYLDYLAKVTEGGGTDSADVVYGAVARWVAREFPLVAIT